VNPGIGGGIEAVEEVGPLQHHGCGCRCSCGLLLPAKLQQIHSGKGGGRGCLRTIRLEGPENVGLIFHRLSRLWDIPKAIAQDVGDRKGQRGLGRRLLLVGGRWQASPRRRVVHIHIDVVLLLRLLLLVGGVRLVVEAQVPDDGVALLFLNGQRCGGGGRGARSGRTAATQALLQCSSMGGVGGSCCSGGGCGGRIKGHGRMVKDTGGQLLLMQLLQLLQLVEMLHLLLLLLLLLLLVVVVEMLHL